MFSDPTLVFRALRGGLILTLLSMVGAAPADAQSVDPRPEDVSTLDGIIDAYYDVVSGPAGEVPDRERDRTLHYPDALVGLAGTDQDGTPGLRTMTIDGYHDLTGGPRQQGFYETEIHRQTQRFGNVVHVWSTYVSSTEPDAEPYAEGINSIQLFFDGQRWWITSWIFDGSAGLVVPAEYRP